MMMVIKAPCHGCEERHATCHAECDKYKEYVVKNREEKERRAKEKQKEYLADTYLIESKISKKPKSFTEWGHRPK